MIWWFWTSLLHAIKQTYWEEEIKVKCDLTDIKTANLLIYYSSQQLAEHYCTTYSEGLVDVDLGTWRSKSRCVCRLLNEAEGSLLDDEHLLITLQTSKTTSQDIKEQLETAEETEEEIDAAREVCPLYYCHACELRSSVMALDERTYSGIQRAFMNWSNPA